MRQIFAGRHEKLRRVEHEDADHIFGKHLVHFCRHHQNVRANDLESRKRVLLWAIPHQKSVVSAAVEEKAHVLEGTQVSGHTLLVPWMLREDPVRVRDSRSRQFRTQGAAIAKRIDG
jgi:hypothetical protein